MSMTKEDVAQAVRRWCTAWHTQDIQTIVAMEARAVGFGFRPLAWRDHIARSEDTMRRCSGGFSARWITTRCSQKTSRRPSQERSVWRGVCTSSSGRRKGTRPNKPECDSPRSSPRTREAGRCCSTTATSSLLLMTGATRGPSRGFRPPPRVVRETGGLLFMPMAVPGLL
jgi:hypothetical protein